LLAGWRVSCWLPVVLVLAALVKPWTLSVCKTTWLAFPPPADMFLNHGGKAAAFAAARQQLTPHAAAALQLAIQHLLLTQTAQHVLPPCTLVCMDGLAGGARTSGAASICRRAAGVAGRPP
jgi:hypothetical protein